jgi:hypothetical protein
LTAPKTYDPACGESHGKESYGRSGERNQRMAANFMPHLMHGECRALFRWFRSTQDLLSG